MHVLRHALMQVLLRMSHLEAAQALLHAFCALACEHLVDAANPSAAAAAANPSPPHADPPAPLDDRASVQRPIPASPAPPPAAARLALAWRAAALPLLLNHVEGLHGVLPPPHAAASHGGGPTDAASRGDDDGRPAMPPQLQAEWPASAPPTSAALCTLRSTARRRWVRCARWGAAWPAAAACLAAGAGALGGRCRALLVAAGRRGAARRGRCGAAG